jgi:DNA-binding transcriptional LysR family regulator
MSYIETRLLNYFVAVAEEQNFARAAERVGITPPTLTHQIQKLESDLGTKLLQRRPGRKVVVTEAGQRVLTRAREILRQVEETAAIARQAGRGELGRLELGFMTSVFERGLLRRWIGAFELANPAIDIAIYRLSPMAQIDKIARNELDAGFARTPNKYPSGVRGFDVYRQPLVLALPSEHPLARHKDLSPAMLAREAFITTTPELDLGFFGFTEAVADIGNFIPRVVKRENDFVPVLAYVGLGRGIAVVPELMKTRSVDNVIFRNIAADPVPQTSIAFVYGSNPSPSTNLLIRHMRRHALRNHGKGAAPPHSHDRVMIPSALNLDPGPNIDPHPEGARPQGEPRRMWPRRRGLALRGSALTRRAPHQGEEMSQR